MYTAHTNQHAIVIGGSIAGLFAARVLHAHFEQVTILERDPVGDGPESRKGQPQTRHVHGLLAGGLQIFTHYFPDLPDALVAHGAIMNDMGESMNWYTLGGYRRRVHLGLNGVSVSRPLLEYLVRQRVLTLPNVSLRDNCAIRRLLVTPDGSRVTGVVIERRDQARETLELSADLVIDCTGRGSRSPQWLRELGYDAPPESEVKVDVAYASRLYRRDPADPRGKSWTIVSPHGPQETRFGAAFAIDGERWIVSIGGWGGDHSPTDEAGFLAYARGLPGPDVYEIIRDAQPLSDIIVHKIASSLRRHYEKMAKFPQGYLVLGDAVGSMNPTYGQGMTSAAMQAKALDEILAAGTPAPRLAKTFFKRAARVVDMSWDMAAGEDFRFATTTGPKPLGTDLLNKYTAWVERATLVDDKVCAAFLKVMNMLAPPTSLLSPGIMWRVFRRRRAVVDQPPAMLPAAGD